jgi:hypothetical protein
MYEAMAENAKEAAVEFKQVAISGFVSKEKGFAEQQIFLDIFGKGYCSGVKAITDDLQFARKRLVSPKTVYSGLIDVLEYAVVEPGNMESLEASIKGQDAWIAYDVTPAELPAYAEIAAKSNLKRVLFAVKCTTEEETGANFTFYDTRVILRAAEVDYTIIKYAKTRPMAEAKFPYRIMTGDKALPTTVQGDPQSAIAVSSGDLLRVIAESFDIEKTYSGVYGIGPGFSLDYEIMCYIKSRGFPERAQVGMLMGPFMQRMEEKWETDTIARMEKDAREASMPVKKVIATGLAEEGIAQNNGFFL